MGHCFVQRHAGNVHALDVYAVEKRVHAHSVALMAEVPVFDELPAAQNQQHRDQRRERQRDAHLPAAALAQELFRLRPLRADGLGGRFAGPCLFCGLAFLFLHLCFAHVSRPDQRFTRRLRVILIILYWWRFVIFLSQTPCKKTLSIPRRVFDAARFAQGAHILFMPLR